MDKRIKGLRYNTDTAKKIGQYQPDIAVSDNDWYKETLYKKRTGEFFLYGEGNASSSYHKLAYKAWTPGEGIRPLTYQQAKEWFEKANNFDKEDAPESVYQKEFGSIKPSEKTVIASISLHETAKKRLERMAQKQGTSQSQIVENLIMSE